MILRTISDELQQIAIQELLEDSRRIEEDIQQFRKWLEKQPHLQIQAEDQIFLSFLRRSKWSLQRAKEKFDYFYTIRTLIPEFFRDRDPFSPEIQLMLQKGMCYVLPKPEGISGPRIFVVDYSRFVPEQMTLVNITKLFFMVCDILLNEDDNFVISGVKFVIDHTQMPLSFLLQFTPDIVKKFARCIQYGYPLRMKKMVGIHALPGMEMVINNVFRPLLTKKLSERIVFYSSSNSEKISDHIEKSFLHEKCGGENGSTLDLTETWKTKIESYKEWFLKDCKNLCDERLRQGKPISYNEEFNIEGTFRALAID